MNESQGVVVLDQVQLPCQRTIKQGGDVGIGRGSGLPLPLAVVHVLTQEVALLQPAHHLPAQTRPGHVFWDREPWESLAAEVVPE